MSTVSTQTDPPESTDLATKASSQTLQSFDTPSPVSQSLSFREGHVPPRRRGRGGRGRGQRAGKVHSSCPSIPDLIENNSQDDTFSSPTHSSEEVHMEQSLTQRVSWVSSGHPNEVFDTHRVSKFPRVSKWVSKLSSCMRV